jgi:hypothetical protein
MILSSKEDLSNPQKPWTEVVAAKRAVRDAIIQKHQPDINLQLLPLGPDAVDIEYIINLLETKQVSALDLIRNYIARWVSTYSNKRIIFPKVY